MPPNQERHYNIQKLNKCFAIASLLLLAGIIALFANDYDREWKKYQREFRALDLKKTRQKLTQEKKALQENKRLEEITQQLDAARREVQAQSEKIELLQKKRSSVEATVNLMQQRFQFAKAEYDSAKYFYEEALAKNRDNRERLRTRFEQARQTMQQREREFEQAKERLEDLNTQLDVLTDEVQQLTKEKNALTRQVDVLQRKIQKLDVHQMNFTNKLAAMIRDLPIVEMANPTLKVDQIVLRDIKDDFNFNPVPKVDRCTTCHLGINTPGFEDAPQPFTTHPDLELYLSSDSPHPMEEFGCTVCHEGRGRATTFVKAVHMPSSPEQKRAWEEKYGWHQDHHWERPMYPMKYVEAGCFKCHSGQTTIPGAEKLNLGLNLIEKSGCFGCHLIEKYSDWTKTGPSLRHISEKTSKAWAFRWVEDPHAMRPDTWMPAFFGQSNNSDEEDLARGEQEIHAMVHYLFAMSEDLALEDMTVSGDPDKGKELVASLGCFGCHQLESQSGQQKLTTRTDLLREHGPTLVGFGQKTSIKWLYNWLKDPARYHPQTRMPNLRLSDKEAADIAVYLSQRSGEEYDLTDIPPVDPKKLDEIVRAFLVKMNTPRQTEDKLAKMTLEQKLMYAGQKLIRHYGCFGCHDIPGFEEDKPIGTELTYEGSKDLHNLDFGFVDIPHTRQAWFKAKLMDPRVFDQDKIKGPYELLKMPNFNYSEQEAEAITTALLGFVDDIPETKVKPRTPKNLFIEAGQKIIREFNCRGCHIIEGEGGAVVPTVADWLVQFENKSEGEAESLASSFGPPNLTGEGRKVRAQWLFNFIHSPEIIRPWLKIRMPTYPFDNESINTLVKYFNYLDDQEFPFSDIVDPHMEPEEYRQAKKLFSNEYFACAQCHIVGDQMPEGSPENWAPDFALSRKRLKPDWIIDWIKDPQAIQPGTKMPTFFDPQYFEISGPDDLFDGDESEQIRALRDYILTLSGEQQADNPGVPLTSDGRQVAGSAENPTQQISE